MEDLITEFRLIAYDTNSKPLGLKEALITLATQLGRPLPSVKRILLLHQLEVVQLHIPTPVILNEFCTSLASISINAKYVRMRTDLPPIPIRRLRILTLLQLDGVIQWQMFQATDGRFSFDCLEVFNLVFTVNYKKKLQFPGFPYAIEFPRLNTLRVRNSTGVYSGLFTHFLVNVLNELKIEDDPGVFGQIDWRILQNVQRLEVQHPTGKFYETTYPSETAQTLFAQQSSVSEVHMLGPIYYPMPPSIPWYNLITLNLAVAIAPKELLTSMIARLPRLEKLHISCVTMKKDNAQQTVYPDLENPPEAPETTTGEGDGAGNEIISESLKSLEFYCHLEFDMRGFYELLCHIMCVRRIVINNAYIRPLRNMLFDKYGLKRYIQFRTYPGTASS
ncbi:hypothetical protein FBU59_002008 [Linderina macrospora]|uniref:Uncharacterized protein n=1 Tax=Linderina macrospora TaxID=4868 RepID=A0ACC1JCP3_9FUNG|nr:hypothetical protein FBU59_002008 [Linderina macrospora]